ncbi:hypothetical protein ACQ9T2_004877 [Escherichia coli]|nr:hypothetical protein [Escherichia coli]
MNSQQELAVHFYKVRDEMKKASDRILRRSVLSILVAASMYIPQTMVKFTEYVTKDNSPVTDETVENGTQYVLNKGKTDNITVGVIWVAKCLLRRLGQKYLY